MRKQTEESLDAFVAELNQQKFGGEGMTAHEMADRLGLSYSMLMKKILPSAKAAGRLVVTTKRIESLSGRPAQVPAYRILGKKNRA